MADRLQIVLAAKDEVTQELKKTRAEMTRLGREARSLSDRMEAGEQGLQAEYEQTRRELEKNRLKQIELGRAASKARSEIREMTSDAVAGARRMDRAFDDAGRSMDRSRGASKKFSLGFAAVSGPMAAVTAAVSAAAGAFTLLSSSVSEARGARKAMAQTAAVMRSMGRTEAPERVNQMVDRLERMAGIDGDQIREMTNVLFTFGNVTGDTFERANKLALDVSVAFGKDLSSSAVMVGKALNDPAKGLTSLQRIGVSFTQQQTDQVKAMMAVGDLAGAQKIILQELTKQVGGSAKAQADGIARTSVAWGNLKEAIGDVLMDTGTGADLVGMLEDATKWISRHKDEIVSVLRKVISIVFKVISIFLKWQSIALKAFGYVAGAVAKLLGWMALLDPRFKGAAEGAERLAGQLGGMSEAADAASKKFSEMSEKSDKASKASKKLKDRIDAVGIAVDKLNNKKVNDLLRDTRIPGVNSQGGVVPGAAMGGPVFGETLVGELGPEVFVPLAGVPRIIGADGPEVRDFRMPGTVIPNHLLAPAAAAAVPAPVVVSAPSGVQIGELHVHDRFDAQRELSALLARERRIAAERR